MRKRRPAPAVVSDHDTDNDLLTHFDDNDIIILVYLLRYGQVHTLPILLLLDVAWVPLPTWSHPAMEWKHAKVRMMTSILGSYLVLISKIRISIYFI